MIKPLEKCPKCKSSQLLIQFTVVMRETCLNCDYLTQRRITPIVSGGQGMIEHLISQALSDEENLAILGAVLQQQLARVERLEARHRHRDNGGSPRGRGKG